LQSRLWRSHTKASSAPELSDDGVVVDVVFEAGLLFLELANLGDRPAMAVSCNFEPSLVDAHWRPLSELALFRHLAFLAPRRRIRSLLGPSHAYSETLSVTVEYSRAGGERATTRLSHDLAAFGELSYVV
jgi:hypothetical protein